MFWLPGGCTVEVLVTLITRSQPPPSATVENVAVPETGLPPMELAQAYVTGLKGVALAVCGRTVAHVSSSVQQSAGPRNSVIPRECKFHLSRLEPRKSRVYRRE